MARLCDIIDDQIPLSALREHGPYTSKFGRLGTNEFAAIYFNRRYGPLRGPYLLAPAEGFGLRPRHFFRAKKELIMLFWPVLGHFWCPVVTLVTFSNNHSLFEKNP